MIYEERLDGPQRFPHISEISKMNYSSNFPDQELDILLSDDFWNKLEKYDRLTISDMVHWNPLLLMLAKSHDYSFIKTV